MYIPYAIRLIMYIGKIDNLCELIKPFSRQNNNFTIGKYILSSSFNDVFS